MDARPGQRLRGSGGRLFVGDLGHETGWLRAARALALVMLRASPRGRHRGGGPGRPRTDPLRAGYLLWGAWLVVLGAAFSATSTINGYYTAALAPAVAGVVGIGRGRPAAGVADAARGRRGGHRRLSGLRRLAARRG